MNGQWGLSYLFLFTWETWLLVYFVCACVHLPFVLIQELDDFPWLLPTDGLFTYLKKSSNIY